MNSSQMVLEEFCSMTQSYHHLAKWLIGGSNSICYYIPLGAFSALTIKIKSQNQVEVKDGMHVAISVKILYKSQTTANITLKFNFEQSLLLCYLHNMDLFQFFSESCH